MAQFPTITATRTTNTQARLEWSALPSQYTTTYLYVSVDGGEWVSFGQTAAQQTWYMYYISEEHSYRFRGRAYKSGPPSGYTDYSDPSNTIYGPIAAPKSMVIRPIYNADPYATNASVTLDNPSSMADHVEYQWSNTSAGRDWLMTPLTAPGNTSFDIYIPGLMWFRVRNVDANDEVSDWLTSDGGFVTAKQPAKPTLLDSTPANFNVDDGTASLGWVYNNTDNSTQGQYELRYKESTVGSWYATVSGTTASEYQLDVASFMSAASLTAPFAISYEVRTKSSSGYPSWSDWSDPRTFNVYSAPSLHIDQPVSGGTVTGMPLSISATYSDMAGFSCISATVSLRKDGNLLYSGPATVSGGTITASIGISDVTLDTGTEYVVSMSASSSSGLQASASSTFTTSFAEPVSGSLAITNDPSTGYASIVASFDNSGGEPAVSVSVARINPDGTRVQLITEGASGSSFTDMYAPLNTAYQYAVSTMSGAGAVKTVYFDNEIETDLWFVYWKSAEAGAVVDNVASAKWNPSQTGINISRPQKTRVYYAGRKDPVSYDGHAISLTETPSWMFIEKSEADVFVKLINDGGRGIYKSCDGWVYHADFDLALTPSYTSIGYYGGASLGITRIAGDAL